MTVAVYVPGKFLVADKRSTGGYRGITHDANKINMVKDTSDNLTYLVLAGIAIMPAFVEVLIKKHFHSTESKKITLSERLYKFKEEISPYVGENYEGILIFVKHGTNTSIDAFKLTKEQVSEVKEFCAIGSGGYYAEGIYLSNKDTPPEDYPFLISQREITVGPESDIIKF